MFSQIMAYNIFQFHIRLKTIDLNHSTEAKIYKLLGFVAIVLHSWNVNYFLVYRCDGRGDCLDGTDEAECKAFVQSLGYGKFLVPPPAENEKEVKVSYAFNIKDIIEINEKDGFLRCKLIFKRRWFDRRITFENLQATNIINPDDKDLLWRPKTIFNNMEDRDKKAKTDRTEEWLIRSNPNTSFVLADKSFVHNTYLFDGSYNRINFFIAYTAEWLCVFHMEWYPFDTQVFLWYSVFGFGIWRHPLVTKPYFWYSVFGFDIWRHSFVTQICKMEFLQQQASVRPIPEKVEVDDMTLPQHYLKGTRMCYTKIDGLQGVVVEIILGRPLFSTFLTVSSTNLQIHKN